MRQSILLFSLICFLLSASLAQESKDFFFNEFTVSVNRTSFQDNNTENNFGFGLGAYHLFRPAKKLNFVVGLGYNHTSQLKKSMYEGRFAHATDMTYRMNWFSISGGLRQNMGSKTKFFVEAGGFADLVLSSNRSGTITSYVLDENNHLIYTLTAVDEKAGLSSSVGIYVGLGIRIPLSQFELIIKPDYKFGINAFYSYQNQIYNRYFRINIGLKLR